MDTRRFDLLATLAAVALLLLLLLAARSSFAQDCVDDANDHRLRLEMIERGYTRYGCEPYMLEITGTWSPPTEGSPVEHYELHLWGTGQIIDVDFMIRAVFDTTYTTLYHTWLDTLWAEVRGVDAEGREGPWSETGEYVIHDPVPVELYLPWPEGQP